MFMRKLTLCVMMFCMVSFFVGLPFAAAHNGTKAEENALDEAEEDRDNALKQKAKWKKNYDQAMSVIDDLLSEWGDNEASIKDNAWSLANTAAATLIAELIRATNNDENKTDTQNVIESLPTILGVVNAVKAGTALSSDTAKRDEYLSALSLAVGALNEIIAENKKAFAAYESKYNIYVEKMQNHDGGLARVVNHSTSGNYNNVQATPLATIQTTVKDKNAYNVVDTSNMLKFWYHVGDLKRTSHPSSKSFSLFEDFESFWELDDLPNKYKCGGDCGLMFQTPAEHLLICPASPAPPAGCNKGFYSCSDDDQNRHKPRTCKKNKKNGDLCNEPYRNCTNPKFAHKGWWLNTKHSSKGGLIISPLGLYFNAVPGNSHTSDLIASSAYSSVDWYVSSPSDSGRGTLIETDYGDGSSTTASMNYTFPSGVTGDYVITAVVTDSSGTDEASYTVSVSSSSGGTPPTSAPTPAPTTYHVCGVHEDWQSGDHSLQASCSETDSHGQYCTVTNFYACQSHTHVYPPPPTVVAPVWSDIPDPYNLTVGDSFYLDLSSYVTGSPTLSRNGGVIPAGLRYRNGVISGTVRRVESRYFRFTATNSTGSANSEWIKITVTAAQ